MNTSTLPNDNHHIVQIPVDMLVPHPQNPRKDLGDLQELTDSIRENGIYQNLTVVPNPDDQDTFIVIIGHRRLAAAKLAGLDMVPCAVAEMTEKQQLETMLLENMQRADLTIPEEAQGLQLLIDLGESVASLSKATGFSKKTIKNRLLLSAYKVEDVELAFKKGATLEDYVKLSKIKDDKIRAEAMKYLGTSDFKWKLENSLNKDRWLTEKDQIVEILQSVGAVERTGPGVVTCKRTDYIYTKADAKRILNEREGRDLMYYLPYDSAGYFVVMFMYLESEKPAASAPSAISEEHLRREFCYVRHESLSKALKSCIRSFIEGFDISAHASTSAEMRYIRDLIFIGIKANAENNGFTTYSEGDIILDMLDLDRKQITERVDDHDLLRDECADAIKADIGKNTLKYLLVWCWSNNTIRRAPATFYRYSSNTGVCAQRNGNPYLEMFVDILVRIGFNLPDELRSYLDGTHPIYTTEGCKQLYADRNKKEE